MRHHDPVRAPAAVPALDPFHTAPDDAADDVLNGALDDTLEFMRTIWAIDHELERVSKRMETRLGLTIPQRMSLLLIARQPGVLASDLAALLHLHRGTLSGIVGRLGAAGLIERTTDEGDARRIRLTLTPAGSAAVERRSGTFEAAVRRLLTTTPARDRRTTARVLAAFAAELRSVGG